ncbi:MAG: polymer-forming cytoskeletal protein [Lysobacterales bacterium]|jgi:cytoskeletal protein CcmA (bactofilin family)|nr:MAG: polymer-forming cytoskeletal protein [Xanthomonadales bacterium]
MFRKRHQPVIEVSKLSSLIAPGVEIAGDVIVTDGLRVDGRIEGNVRAKPGSQGLLVLSERGSIRGTVHVHDAVVNGTIDGDVEVEHYLELQANARVTGNITYRQLRLDCGAVVQGRLERLSDAVAQEPAGNVVNVQFAQAAP